MDPAALVKLEQAVETASGGSVYEAANEELYCLDLNVSTAEELAELPNVGPARARPIIRIRSWGSVRELTRVSGLGGGAASVRDIGESWLFCPDR